MNDATFTDAQVNRLLSVRYFLCCHEAAHAIVARHLGIPVISAAVDPSPITQTLPGAGTTVDLAMIAIAGLVIDAIREHRQDVVEDPIFDPASTDWQALVELGISSEQQVTLQTEVRKIIFDNIRELDSLARKIDRRGILQGTEIWSEDYGDAPIRGTPFLEQLSHRYAGVVCAAR